MFLSLVSNGTRNLILLGFFMGINSITALKLPAIVPKVLNKKEAFLSGWFLRLSSSSLFTFNEHLIYGIFFSPILLKGKRYKNCSNDL